MELNFSLELGFSILPIIPPILGADFQLNVFFDKDFQRLIGCALGSIDFPVSVIAERQLPAMAAGAKAVALIGLESDSILILLCWLSHYFHPS